MDFQGCGPTREILQELVWASKVRGSSRSMLRLPAESPPATFASPNRVTPRAPCGARLIHGTRASRCRIANNCCVPVFQRWEEASRVSPGSCQGLAGFRTGSGQMGFSQKGHKSHTCRHRLCLSAHMLPHVAICCHMLMLPCVATCRPQPPRSPWNPQQPFWPLSESTRPSAHAEALANNAEMRAEAAEVSPKQHTDMGALYSSP